MFDWPEDMQSHAFLTVSWQAAFVIKLSWV